MSALSEIMQLIDTNSDAMPEGDYLKLCGLMKNVFDDMSKKAPVVQQPWQPPRPRRLRQPVPISPPTKERYRFNQQAWARARDNITKFSRELNKLKIRSRVTEAVKVEAGSDDREICKQFLRDTNTKVIQRRCELEAEISRLEEVRRTSREVCDIIDGQAMRLMTELNASNPDVDFFITYWQ
jgi:hypothetical protein